MSFRSRLYSSTPSTVKMLPLPLSLAIAQLPKNW